MIFIKVQFQGAHTFFAATSAHPELQAKVILSSCITTIYWEDKNYMKTRIWLKYQESLDDCLNDTHTLSWICQYYNSNLTGQVLLRCRSQSQLVASRIAGAAIGRDSSSNR